MFSPSAQNAPWPLNKYTQRVFLEGEGWGCKVGGKSWRVYLIILLSCLPSIEEPTYTLVPSPWSRPSTSSSRLKKPSWWRLNTYYPLTWRKDIQTEARWSICKFKVLLRRFSTFLDTYSCSFFLFGWLLRAASRLRFPKSVAISQGVSTVEQTHTNRSCKCLTNTSLNGVKAFSLNDALHITVSCSSYSRTPSHISHLWTIVYSQKECVQHCRCTLTTKYHMGEAIFIQNMPRFHAVSLMAKQDCVPQTHWEVVTLGPDRWNNAYQAFNTALHTQRARKTAVIYHCFFSLSFFINSCHPHTNANSTIALLRSGACLQVKGDPSPHHSHQLLLPSQLWPCRNIV